VSKNQEQLAKTTFQCVVVVLPSTTKLPTSVSLLREILCSFILMLSHLLFLDHRLRSEG